ncbi:MAG: hypothetical protein MSS69_00730 [Spirochaetales bacterium]|nr:hypothetical protein [Spirochaetales bacterium]
MKRIVIALLVLSLSIISLSAMDSAGSTFSGFAGIPVGSKNYQGGSWSGSGETDPEHSSDAEMIALISFWNIDSASRSKPFTISISCPNGMYMTSISNPTFKRPFEIEFNPSYSDGGTVRGTGFKLSNDNPVYQFTMTQNCNNMWFDVVVCLPVKDLGGGNYGMDYESDRLTVVENGRDVVYPLVEADDYTALVTIKIEHDDLAQPLELLIPFSGYYKHDTTATNHKNNSTYFVAMDVQTYPEAKNIDLGVSNRGKWISVGYLSFLINGQSLGGNPPNKAAIFLSSSPVATVAGEEFTLKKDDLTYTDVLTTTNSIKFEVQLIGDDGSINAFDGTDSFDTSKTTISALPENFVRLLDDSSVNHTVFRDPGHNSKNMYNRSYNGTMQVKIEQSDVTLAAGKYEGDIYVHVLVEK